MIILSKKEDIYNISLAISIFLEKIGLKGNLFIKLNKIIKIWKKQMKKTLF